MTKLKYLTPIQHKYNTNSNTNSINLTKFGQNWQNFTRIINTNTTQIQLCYEYPLNTDMSFKKY